MFLLGVMSPTAAAFIIYCIVIRPHVHLDKGVLLADPCSLRLSCCCLHVKIAIPVFFGSRSGGNCYLLPFSVLPAYLLYISPYIHGDEGVLLADP